MTILNYEAIPDASFYVYMRDKPDRINTIKNKSLWFSCCDAFNDPYDSQLDMHNDIDNEKYFQMAIHTLIVDGMKQSQKLAAEVMLEVGSDEAEKEKEKEKFLSEYGDQTLKNIALKHGIVCFSINGLSHQMWGYYADKHQGLCVEYEKPTQESLTELDASFGAVSYGKSAKIRFSSLVNYFRKAATTEEKSAYLRVLLDEHFYQKEINWQHESEYRIVSRQYCNKLAPFDCKIKSITFGMKMLNARKLEIYNDLKSSLDETIFRNVIRKNCSWDMEPRAFDPNNT